MVLPPDSPKPGLVRIEQGDPALPKSIVQMQVPNALTARDGLSKLVEAAGGWSRNEFAAALEEAGLPRRKSKFQDESALPRGTEEALAQMTVVSQFGALRDLHAEVRARGESPELLGALIRAYANLGVLTEHLWVADHKVYKARALLYAERLRNRRPNEPWALWHRAYAEALVGLHAAALADLKAAADLKSSRSPPAWVALIDPVCRFEEAKIARLAEKPGLARLARLLRYLAVEDYRTVHLTLSAGRAVLQENPECTRVLCSICGMGYVGNKHVATTSYLAALADEAPRAVAALPTLPGDLATRIRRGASEPEIWKALAALGERDAGELSWGALGRILQEDRFLSVWQRVTFMHDVWSVPVDEFIEGARPLIEGHPRQDIILLYAAGDSIDAADNARLTKAVTPDDVEAHHRGVLSSAHQVGAFTAARITMAAMHQADAVYRDHAVMMQYVTDNLMKAQDSRQMLAVSPHNPASIAALLEIDFAMPDPKVAAWEVDEGHRGLRAARSGLPFPGATALGRRRTLLAGVPATLARRRRLYEPRRSREGTG